MLQTTYFLQVSFEKLFTRITGKGLVVELKKTFIDTVSLSSLLHAMYLSTYPDDHCKKETYLFTHNFLKSL